MTQGRERALYVSGGHPCSEMFARHDGCNPRTSVITHPDRLRGMNYRGLRINVVQGWWVNKSMDEVNEWMFALGAVKALGGEVVERSESEIGVDRPEMHPWTTVNPYRIERERRALKAIRRMETRKQRQDALDMAYMTAYVQYHDYISAARLADAT